MMFLAPRTRILFPSIVFATALFAGCATAPPPAAPAPAPQVQPLAEYMTVAAKAHADRMTSQERETYRTASRAYPTAKEPWAKLAESYFEAGDYGNAILAAQEVVSRDAADPVAASLLAVSGLRVATQALGTLRNQKSDLSTDSRTQAESLTKTLRELLGESVLVPPPVAEPAASAPTPAPRRARVPPKAASAPVPATAASAAPKPAPAKNPFDGLR